MVEFLKNRGFDLYSFQKQINKTIIPKVAGLFLILFSCWTIYYILNSLAYYVLVLHPNIKGPALLRQKVISQMFQDIAMTQFGPLFSILISKDFDLPFLINLEILNLVLCLILEILIFKNKRKIVSSYSILSLLILLFPFLNYSSSLNRQIDLSPVSAYKVLFSIPYIIILFYYCYLENKNINLDTFLTKKFFQIKKPVSHRQKAGQSVANRTYPIARVDDHLHALEEIINENL